MFLPQPFPGILQHRWRTRSRPWGQAPGSEETQAPPQHLPGLGRQRRLLEAFTCCEETFQVQGQVCLSSIPTDTKCYAIFRKSLLSASIQFIRLRARKNKYSWMESAGTGQANALFAQGLLTGSLLFPPVSRGGMQSVLLLTGGRLLRETLTPAESRSCSRVFWRETSVVAAGTALLTPSPALEHTTR